LEAGVLKGRLAEELQHRSVLTVGIEVTNLWSVLLAHSGLVATLAVDEVAGHQVASIGLQPAVLPLGAAIG